MKKFIIGLCVALMTLGGGNIPHFSGPDIAYAGSPGGSRPSSSGGSRPSSSSGGSRPSAPSVRPSAPAPTQRPPSVRPGQPAAPSSGGNSAGSSKPQNGSVDASAASDKNRADSAQVYKGSAPKASYTTPSGKPVTINPNSPQTTRVRSMSDDAYRNRSVRIENHYHTVYGSRYDYYRTQPYIDVGGGYSPIFWYAMMDWNIDRQAQWLYNNQSQINADLYNQRLQNAELRAKIEQMQKNGVKADPNYVDPEFKDNPDLMMDDNFVNAAYNPDNGSSIGSIVCWTVGVLFTLALIAGIIYFVFIRENDRYTYA